MNQLLDRKKLSDVGDALTATILGIINDKLSELHAEQATQTSSRPATDDRLLTKQQVAAHFQVSTRTIDNWLSCHALPHYKLGKAVRFKLSDVKTYLDSNYLRKRRKR